MDLIYEMDEVDEGGKIVKYEVQGTKEWLSVIGYR